MRDALTTPPASASGTLDEGVVLVLKAEEAGDWRSVIEWLARNPGAASGLANFLATQRGLKAAVAPLAGLAAIPGLELLEEIGRGAFGVVHRARDTALNKDVAVKIVQALSEGERTRFRFEAEAAAGLDHDNVVPVYSSGESGGVPYLVMKLMPGGCLADWLRAKGPDRMLPPKQAAEIVRAIALGAHHAHQRGLIHRDLKPGNVLLDEGRWRITDFGLARLADRSAGLTASGAILGTPAYMAPEQARGEKRLTTAVDIHALGVILFELLAGKTPFGSEDPISVLMRIAEETAPPLRSLRADVPTDLEAICCRCLEKRPEDRYPSAQAVADDLGRYLAGEPIGRGASGWWDKLFHAIGRRRETDSMGSWHVPLWGAASVVAAMAGLQAAVSLSAPPWVGWAAVGYYLLAWAGILWWFLFARWGCLNPVEKNSALAQVGLVLACAACLPALAGPGGDVVRALPAFLALKGLTIFVHGQWYWGRLYLVGVLYFALAAMMPLIPPAIWPAAFGLLSGGFQLWVAVHLLRAHRDAVAAR